MQMAALRYAGTRYWLLREPVALDDRHLVGVLGEHVRGQQARETASNDDGMPPTRSP
jgi:hypothetical protein